MRSSVTSTTDILEAQEWQVILAPLTPLAFLAPLALALLSRPHLQQQPQAKGLALVRIIKQFVTAQKVQELLDEGPQDRALLP